MYRNDNQVKSEIERLLKDGDGAALNDIEDIGKERGHTSFRGMFSYHAPFNILGRAKVCFDPSAQVRQL